MFASGTHKKNWIFPNENKLKELREEANALYIENYSYDNSGTIPDFLTSAEEKDLCEYFEVTLHDFCKKFKPPMPKCITGCALHYYKRFYLNNSVMNYHPKHIIVTCVFLACKVEEFNVSIMQFVSNVRGDRAKAKEIILSHELLLMMHLDYNLVVHHPYRPVEGFLIDMKARCPQIENPERFRQFIDEFLDCMFFTNAYLLYAPSQIALAAVAYAGRKFKEDVIEKYICGVLLKDSPHDVVSSSIAVIEKMWMMKAKKFSVPSKDRIKAIEKKLEKCRNEENNPNSAA